jgi:hypothetical protein
MATAEQDVGTVGEKPAVKRRTRKPKAVPETQPPEEFVVEDSKVTIESGGEQFLSVEEFRKKLAGPPPGIYPEGAELFSFTPDTTGETIWFPLDFRQPDMVWLWEMYEKPFHVQSWEWMKKAEIPRDIQRKAVELGRDNPAEYMEMFAQWFAALSGGSAKLGES